MLTIPLAPVPSQTLAVILAGQNCALSVYTETTGILMDIAVNNANIATTRVLEDGARVLRDLQYAGFVGDFIMVDTQGELDPDYTGLGTRWVLVYLEAADLVTYGSI
jgi:hypothetical protein